MSYRKRAFLKLPQHQMQWLIASVYSLITKLLCGGLNCVTMDLPGITFIMTLLHGMFGPKRGIRLRAKRTLGFPVMETSGIPSSSTH